MENDVYWAAGLFDGEGCVTTLWPNRKQVRLEINMVNKPSLERLANILGGVVRPSYSKSTDKINRKKQWRWRVVDKEAIRIANILFPICTEKSNQLKYIIQFKLAKSDDERQIISDLIRAEKRLEYE